MTVTIKGDSNVNLDYSSGGRITGDFTNATVLNRAMFQTSTANSTTGIYALPSGTSTAASWQATNNADPTNASKVLIATNGTTDCQLVSGRNGSGTYLPLTFYTNGSEQMRLDASGNLGLGVTPSAWIVYKAFDIGPYSSLSAAGAEVEVNSNAAYLAGTGWTYKQTGVASQYRQTIGQHRWYTATSGTAGNAISFTQAMTLDASGNLLVGKTASGALNVGFQAFSSGEATAVTSSATTGSGPLFYLTNAAASVPNGYRFISFRSTSSFNEIGTITQLSSTTVAYNTSSDQRLKTNVTPAGSAIESILNFPVDQFDWISTGEHQDFGAVAQKAINFIPEMVSVPADEDAMWGIDWSKAVPRLIKTIQELSARLEALEGAK